MFHYLYFLPCIALLFVGQRLNFTLYDFGFWAASHQVQPCTTSVRIHETTTGDETILCRGDQRISNPYVSKTNIVDISFMVEFGVSTRTELLLHYQGKHFKIYQIIFVQFFKVDSYSKYYCMGLYIHVFVIDQIYFSDWM